MLEGGDQVGTSDCKPHACFNSLDRVPEPILFWRGGRVYNPTHMSFWVLQPTVNLVA